MSAVEVAADCGTDVLVSFTESLRVSTGLLTVAAVCGGLSGILAASLLYLFCMKPLLLTRQVYHARRLLEPDVGDMDDNQSDGDGVCNSRKEAASGTTNGKEKKQTPINNDVAAFASRAKVVYPINQKYRPLADGASNPSLHAHSKLPAVSNEESSSSADEECPTQEQDNNGSSQFISSVMVPKSLQNQSITRVSHYPHTLTQLSFQGRVSLYCLALQELQHHSSQLEEEKYLIFLQMVKTIFNGRFPKDKNDADFTKNIIQKQEQELEKLRKQLLINQTHDETSPDASCSLEDIERAQKDHFERSLQTSKRFARQVEDLCQLLLKRSSVFSPEDAQNVISSLTQALLLVENHLMNLQQADLKRTLEKVLWWEELSGLAHTQPALLRWEVNQRQSLIATMLEQLTSDNILKFSHMEKILSEIQVGLSEGLQQSTEECVRKMKELVNEKCSKKESKTKKLQRSQINKKNRALDSCSGDLQELTAVYRELLMKHRKQISDLELQQDNKVAEALCDLWKKLRGSCSKRLGEIAKGIFLSTVPAQTSLTAEHCENLWLDVEQELAAQLQQAECTTKQQLEDIRTALNKDGQVWVEEMVLVQDCLKHLGEQQMKILRAMVARQSYTLNSQTGKLLERKHEHLSVQVQKLFVVRHFCLRMLKEMRLSKLKTLSQTDFRALLMEDAPKSQVCANSALKSSSASLAERQLGPGSQLLGNNLQQEFLSELETATELLQSHAQLVLGNALSHAIQHKMKATPTQSHTSPKQDTGMILRLTEAAAESVYVTKDSLRALVGSYYSHLQDITSKLEQDLSNINQETSERYDCSRQLSKTLMRELENWGRKPASVEFQQRVEQNKKKVLKQLDLDQELMNEELRRRKVALDQTVERIKTELMEAEESFITELAALAHVSVHSPDMEPSDEEDNVGEQSPPTLDLLALNPALDPAFNPSLTPSFVTPKVKSKPKKKEGESHLS